MKETKYVRVLDYGDVKLKETVTTTANSVNISHEQLKEGDDDEITHEYFFGENIRRVMNAFSKDDPEKDIHIDTGEPIELSRVTRVEVIDENGRSYTREQIKSKVELNFQDNYRTLKIFIR